MIQPCPEHVHGEPDDARARRFTADAAIGVVGRECPVDVQGERRAPRRVRAPVHISVTVVRVVLGIRLNPLTHDPAANCVSAASPCAVTVTSCSSSKSRLGVTEMEAVALAEWCALRASSSPSEQAAASKPTNTPRSQSRRLSIRALPGTRTSTSLDRRGHALHRALLPARRTPRNFQRNYSRTVRRLVCGIRRSAARRRAAALACHGRCPRRGTRCAARLSRSP